MSDYGNVICFVSSKGGSGKTVTSASLGTFLSQLGFKVLLVDTDAATNGMTLLFLEQLLQGSPVIKSQRGVGLFEASDDYPSIITITEHLSLVPAAYRITDTENVDPSIFRANLENILSRSPEYDVVLLDAQAGADKYARISTELSDIHIIVSEYDPISAQGIDRLKLIFSRELEPASTYTLFNKVLPEYAQSLGEGIAVARWLPPIPWDVEVVRAFSRRDLAINMTAPNPYTLAIAQVALGCLGDMTGDAIATWQSASLKRVSNPIEQRLQNMEYARRNLYVAEKRRQLARRIGEAGAIAVGFMAIGSNFYSLSPSIDLKYFLIGGLAVAAAIVISLMISFQQRASIAREELTDLDLEIKQLRASLDATKAALEPGEVGVWQALRRKRDRSA